MENYEIDDLEEFNDKYILNEGYILHKVILSSISALGRSIEAGDIQNGMISKNLEIDQALKICYSIDLFTKKELKEYLKKNGIKENKKEKQNLDQLVNDTKKANYILGFIISKAKQKRTKLIKGII